jgi:hypothetical protein
MDIAVKQIAPMMMRKCPSTIMLSVSSMARIKLEQRKRALILETVKEVSSFSSVL